MSARGLVIGSGPGELVLDAGVITDGDLFIRDGSTFKGVDPSGITAGSASAITTTTGPTVLTIAAIADTEVLTRSGATVDGVLPSAMTVGVATYANGLRETGGPATLTMGAVPNDRLLYRGGGSDITGFAPSTLYANAWSYIDSITSAADIATFDWDTTDRAVGIVHAAAATDVSLPAEASVTNWPAGSPPRKLFKLNASANGINLLVAGNCTINGGAAAADMVPIPDTNATPSVTVLAQWVYVYRLSATAYFVFGGQ